MDITSQNNNINNDIPGCSHIQDDGAGFTTAQVIFRVYIMPATYFFGICGNLCNIYVFSHKQMRSQLVNWFLLVLSINDLCVLMSSFFVFSVPVISEYLGDEYLVSISPKILVSIYPFAHISHTTSVYLTILVSVHRYLGVCHPFLIRRISSKTAVKCVLASALIFSVLFNLPRWFEIKAMECLSETFLTKSSMVVPTYLFMNSTYTILYRNACFTIVMFFFPFITLTWVNCKIVSTLKTSNMIRRRMTNQQGSLTTETPIILTKDATSSRDSVGNASVTRMSLITRKLSKQDLNERKEHGITIMLVAMVTGFLLFNLLAFFNNILELAGEHSDSFTILIELSTLLVNLNGATTIIIYLTFGSKYRTVFLKCARSILHCLGCSKILRQSSMEKLIPNEQTFLIVSSQADITERRRQTLKIISQQSFGSA